MPNTKHTIECCDSWCKADGISTYSELLEVLKEVIYNNNMSLVKIDNRMINKIEVIIAKTEGKL